MSGPRPDPAGPHTRRRASPVHPGRPRLVPPAALLLGVLLGVPAAAQESTPGTITGTVHDSIGGGPLVGATVLLFGEGRSTETNAEGRFVLPGVEPGLRTLTFFHPQLESLGVGSGGWQVQVSPADTVTVHLAVPSAEGIATRLCRGEPAVLVGFLRDTDTGQPVPRGRVTARWGPGEGEVRSAPTDHSGRYVLCGLPRDAPVRVHGAFVRVEGPERRISISGALAVADVRLDLAAPATVRGRVRSLDTGDPVEAAQVRLSGAHRTVLTDREGRFDLGAVAGGRHVLEVEHIAFGVHRDSIDVYAGDGLSLEIEVPTRAIELPGIEVSVEHRYRGHMAGFQSRMERGLGSFITREEIAGRDVVPLPNLIAAHALGFRLICGGSGCAVASSRALRSPMRGGCLPEIWLDGQYMMGGFNLNQLPARDVEAIEAYDSPATIPPRFQTRNAACGVIAVWTRIGGNS